MFHIVDMCWDDGDAALWAKLERDAHRDARSGPCEDSDEMVAPFIGACPDESDKENGSPLRFYSPSDLAWQRSIDGQIEAAMKLGLI